MKSFRTKSERSSLPRSFSTVAALTLLGLTTPLFTGPATAGPTRPDGPAHIGLLELTGSLDEKPGALDWLIGSGSDPTLRELVDAIDKAGSSDEYSALVIRLKDAEFKVTQIEEIGAAITRARASGKKVHVFSESYGGPELSLASYADDVIVQNGGPIELPGVYMEEMFLADTLAWAGIKSEMVQIGDYKGANEQMTRSAPSPQWDQNISQLLDSLYTNSRDRIKKGRKFTDSQLDTAMESAWMTDGEAAQSLGLVDAVIDLPDLNAYIGKAHGGSVTWSSNLAVGSSSDTLDASNPFAMMQKIMSAKPKVKATGATIAVVHIDGAIVDGDSTSGGFMGGGGSVGSRTIRNALEDTLKDDEIKGVIIRIDSPGGSATASEVIWQGIRRVAASKPVWVSVGSMAASGGYYCAVAGDRIYVNPSSVVGSIGVVGGRMSMTGLYDKLKVHVVGRARGPRSAMFRTTEPWTPEELGFVRSKMQETYNLFTKRVSAGRKGIDLAQTAEGRLFAGNKAIDLKMADKVGGLHEAIEDLAAQLSLSDYEIMDLPGPKPLNEVIQDAVRGMVRASSMKSSSATALLDGELAGLARTVVGDHAWPQVRESIEGLLQLRDHPVLLMSPKVLIFR